MTAVKVVHAEEEIDYEVQDMVKDMLPKLLSMEIDRRQEFIGKLFRVLNESLDKIEKHPFKYQPDILLMEDSDDVKFIFNDGIFN